MGAVAVVGGIALVVMKVKGIGLFAAHGVASADGGL